MLDLTSLRIVRRDDPSSRFFGFVGIRKNPADGSQEFWLPQGFQGFPEGSFSDTVDAFFLLYRVMRTFAEGERLREDTSSPRREAFEIRDSGVTYADFEETSPLTFAKLNILEDVLRAFDELALASVLSKSALRTPESYERIDRHLHQAIYSENDSIFIEKLPTSRLEVVRGETDLVRLFSYIYLELAERVLGRERVPQAVVDSAHSFREEYLPDSVGLFHEGSFSITLAVLKEVLDRIDRTVAYKDEDYWKLYDAVESFLYGSLDPESDEGVIWGVTDYHPIWEEMCHAYCLQEFRRTNDRRVVFADGGPLANRRLGTRMVYLEISGGSPFRLEFNRVGRNLFPDLVALMERTDDDLRRDFDDLLVIRRHPEGAVVYQKVTAKVTSDDSNALTWLKGVRDRMGNKGWRSTLVGRSAAWKNVPARQFDTAIKSFREEYVSKRKRSPRHDPRVFILDFKYLSPAEFYTDNLSAKIRGDLIKQRVYHLAMQTHADEHFERVPRIINQFLVPVYEKPRGDEEFFRLPSYPPPSLADARFSNEMRESGVEVIAIPFGDVANAYLTQDDST